MWLPNFALYKVRNVFNFVKIVAWEEFQSSLCYHHAIWIASIVYIPKHISGWAMPKSVEDTSRTSAMRPRAEDSENDLAKTRSCFVCMEKGGLFSRSRSAEVSQLTRGARQLPFHEIALDEAKPWAEPHPYTTWQIPQPRRFSTPRLSPGLNTAPRAAQSTSQNPENMLSKEESST